MKKLHKRMVSLAAALALCAQAFPALTAYAAAPHCTADAAGVHTVSAAGTACASPDAPHIFGGSGLLDASEITGKTVIYAQSGNTVALGTGAAVIYLDGDAAAQAGAQPVVISGFKAGTDKLYVLYASSVPADFAVGAAAPYAVTSGSGADLITVAKVSLSDGSPAWDNTAQNNIQAVLTANAPLTALGQSADLTGDNALLTGDTTGAKLFFSAAGPEQGSVGFQWYKLNSAPAAGSTPAGGTAFGTGQSVAPDTGAAGNAWYYCVATAGSQTVTSGAIAVTVGARSCDYAPSAGALTITPQTDLSFTDAEADAASRTMKLSLPVTFSGTGCTMAGHDGAHGYAVSWSAAFGSAALDPAAFSDRTFTEDPENPGAWIASALLTVGKGQLPAPSAELTVTAVLAQSGQAAAAQAADTALLTRPARCTLDYDAAVMILGSTEITADTIFVGDPLAAETTARTYGVNTSVSGSCEIAGHSHAPVWSVSGGGSWAFIDQNGTLTLSNKLIPKEGATVEVRATLQGGDAGGTQDDVSAVLPVTVSRAAFCDKTLTGILGTCAFSVSGSTRRVFQPVFTGTCELDGDPGHEHAVAWSLPDPAPAGVSIDAAAGEMTVTYSGLASGTTVFSLTAVCDGQPVSQEIRITKRSGSSGGDDSYDRWSDLIRDIRSADADDVVEARLRSGNTEALIGVWEALYEAEDNVTAEADLGEYDWIMNSGSVKKLPADAPARIDLGVTFKSPSAVEKLAEGKDVLIFQLSRTGSLYGELKLKLHLEAEYGGDTLYLYRYDASAGRMVYLTSVKASRTGAVQLPFSAAYETSYVLTKKVLSIAATGTGTGTGGASSAGGSSAPLPASSSSLPESAPSSSGSSGVLESSAAPESSSQAVDADAGAAPEKKRFLTLPIAFAGAGVAAAAALLLVTRRKIE